MAHCGTRATRGLREQPCGSCSAAIRDSVINELFTERGLAKARFFPDQDQPAQSCFSADRHPRVESPPTDVRHSARADLRRCLVGVTIRQQTLVGWVRALNSDKADAGGGSPPNARAIKMMYRQSDGRNTPHGA